jgi:MutS domain V
MTAHGMSLDSTEWGEGAPGKVYSQRLEELRTAQAAEERREKTMGYAKLLLALITLVVAAGLLIYHPATLSLVFAPVAVFVLLTVVQERSIRKIRYGARAVSFYERGLKRLNGGWEGSGEAGERFLEPMHPYARDLDIFGKSSLFELLCTARTRAGEETLARWLLAAAPVAAVLERQAAVEELRPLVGFREKLFSLGESVRLGVRPDALASWGEHGPAFGSRWIIVLITSLGVLWIASLACWGIWGWSSLALLTTLVNFGCFLRLARPMEQGANSVEKAAEDLKLLAEVLALLESERFSSPKLMRIQAGLKREGVAPSGAIRKLARIAEYLASRRNQFARIFDLFTFWSAQLVFASERWQREFGASIRGWLDAVGEFEALTALAGFAYEHPQYVFSEFAEEGPLFEAEGFAHPLLPAEAVTNDLRLGDGLQLIVLSGPNMAGKSTFIRGLGVSAVLAQCGAPVRALRLRLSPLQVGASICVLDSLSGGMSRFYAEIHRVKLICDLTNGPVPVLFLLDELLSGTNSHDRLEGTELVVRSLLEREAIGIVSTHDLALTQIPETLGERAVNCHFEDRLEKEELIFDYKLKPGIVQTSNALKLMRSIGLGRLGESVGSGTGG